MSDFKSTQVTNRDAVPIQDLAPDESGGRVRALFFEFTVPAGNVDPDEDVDLVEFPTRGRILGGYIAAEAMTTAGGAASIQVGITGTPAKYLGTTSIDAAAEAQFAHTIALAYGERIAAGTRLIATCKTEAWAAGQVLKGHVLYVAD